MEEEFDLKPYFEALVKQWKWVAAGAILAALVALGVSFFRSPTYNATALVAVALPRQIVEFDNRITSTSDHQPTKSYPQLAMSDELLLSLLGEITQFAPEVEKLSELRALLSATPGLDPGLISLSASYGEPQIAAKIVNRWAELFVVEANAVFGTQSDEQLGFFEDQLASAGQELRKADENLIEFQAGNPIIILGNELMSLEQTHKNYLAKQRQIVFLQQDVENLLNQLTDANEGDISIEDHLGTIVLQLRALSGLPSSSAGTPLNLQVNLDQITNTSGQDQIEFLFGLQDSLQAQEEGIDVLLAELEPQILTLQRDTKGVEIAAGQIKREREVAEEIYTALVRKVAEDQITSQENPVSGVRLASRSAVPEDPTGPRKLVVIFSGLVIGAALSIITIVAITWWNNYFDTT